jgi:ABC-2 type transport system permease protein
MLRDPFTKWLWDGRRWLLGWMAAIAGVGGFYAAFWPTFDNPDIQKFLAEYPKTLLDALNYNDIATPAGYLDATVYGLVVATLSVVFGLSAGARIVAGDEEGGTLDLILAHPVSRGRLALQRFGAFVVGAVGTSLALLVVILVLSGPFRLTGISAGSFAAMHLQLVLFTVFFGAVAYAVGSATGRRGWALGVGAGVAVFAFAANGILPQVEGLEWIRGFSAYDWLNGVSPLEYGLQPWDVTLMIVLSVLLVGIGTWGFCRRDVGV